MSRSFFFFFFVFNVSFIIDDMRYKFQFGNKISNVILIQRNEVFFNPDTTECFLTFCLCSILVIKISIAGKNIF